MRNNKILATAITTALAGALSAGGVSAGSLSIVTFPNGSSTGDNIPRYVATEAIGTGQTLPDICSTKITAVYQLDEDEKLDLNDLVTLQLLEGSTLAEGAMFDTGAGAGQVSPNTLTINTGPTGTGSGSFALSDGGDGEPTLEFVIQGSGAPVGSTLTFTFCIGNADILAEQGQSIGLSLSVNGSVDDSETILSSLQGSEASIDAGRDDGDVKVNIGSGAGAKNFTGSSIAETTAILGRVCVAENDTISLYNNTLANYWLLVEEEDGTTNTLSDYTFDVTDAPFNASIGHTYDGNTYDSDNPDDVAGVMVFLDWNENDDYDDGTDAPADTVTTTSATFSGSAANILDDKQEDNGDRCANLVFKVSGNDEIKTHDVPPTGKLTLAFENGRVQKTFSGKMNHIKRSGTVCVLYNIPGPNSIENANIRVTNKTATPDGTLIGTLRLPDGTEIFTDYDILTAAGLGLIGSNQTLYFNTDTLNTIAQSASNPNGAWTDGWARAILRLETNLNTVEMMALIRDDDVLGAPLMNMSTGASGNGWDR
jgi:hypothetical protein